MLKINSNLKIKFKKKADVCATAKPNTMLTAKFTLTDKVDKNGERIFEVGDVVRVNKEDYKEQEKKVQAYEEFLVNVADVNISKLNKKFTI